MVMVVFWNFSSVVRTESNWCVFRVKVCFQIFPVNCGQGLTSPFKKTLPFFTWIFHTFLSLFLVGVQHFRKESWSWACCVWRQWSSDRLCVVTRSEVESEADGEYVSCCYLPYERNQIPQRSQSVTSPSLEKHPTKRTGNYINLFLTHWLLCRP